MILLNDEFNIELKEITEKIDKIIDYYMPEGNGLPQKTIFDSMKYTLSAGGKRIRGAIMASFCKLCGGNITDVSPFIAAIEMIHAYSLIHDDLPCMDDDDLRRGKPTNHKVFGEAIAVLSGDGLLNLAFETVLNNMPNNDKTYRSLKELAAASGIYGMVGGQVIDIESENKKVDLTTLCEMHEKKTGALFYAAAKIGCIMGGGTEKQIEDGGKYAKKIGILFQITDDLLDVYGDSKMLGKNTGQDLKKNKSTFVSILGIAGASQYANKCYEEAIESLKEFENPKFLINLTKYLLQRCK